MRAVQRIRIAATAFALLAASSAGSARVALAQRTPPGAEKQFVVIVGEASPLTTVSREQLSEIFLRKAKTLPGGREAMPVDMVGHVPVRVAFSNVVHGRSLVAIQNFWSQQIFNGKDVPPPQMAREADIVAFVRTNRDAVGYVSPGAALGAGVRIVRIE